MLEPDGLAASGGGGAATRGLLHALNVVLMVLFRLGARWCNVVVVAASNTFIRFRDGCIA